MMSARSARVVWRVLFNSGIMTGKHSFKSYAASLVSG